MLLHSYEIKQLNDLSEDGVDGGFLAAKSWDRQELGENPAVRQLILTSLCNRRRIRSREI